LNTATDVCEAEQECRCSRCFLLAPVQDEGKIASHTPYKREVNPEHGIWFKEARDHEAPRVDGLKADVRGQLQHGWFLRVIVAADKYDGPLTVEGRRP
jgi:hypothetical protein